MLPDVSGIDKSFDYRLPPALGDIEPGSIVRVPLAGRVVRGWVTDVCLEPPDGLDPAAVRDVRAFASLGANDDTLALAEWSAWRYAGRLRPFLLAASPPRRVPQLPGSTLPGSVVTATRAARPAPAGDTPVGQEGGAVEVAQLVDSAVRSAVSVLRLPPAAGRLAVVTEMVARCGPTVLVAVPTRAEALRLAGLLRSAGHTALVHPDDWPAAAGGAGTVIVGSRSAVFARARHLSSIVVLDAHSDSFTDTRAPTWNAPVLAAERARRARIPCVLVSPCPTLEMLAAGTLVAASRGPERQGWAPIAVIDRRGEDPRSGLYPEQVVVEARRALADETRPVLFVLNRTGTARIVRCAACGALATCENCGASLAKSPSGDGPDLLHCPHGCGTRPPVCSECGGGRLKLFSPGTRRALKDLTALFTVPVAEVTAKENARTKPEVALDPAVRVFIGTEALLHRARSASLVVFLDFDLDLASPRLRAAEHALWLLAAASRLVGGRRRGGRVLVQTRMPEHEVIVAAAAADPARLSNAESARRQRLRLPPACAVALLSGTEATELAAVLEVEHGIETAETDEGVLVRADNIELLCDALSACRPLGFDVRVEVDPLGL